MNYDEETVIDVLKDLEAYATLRENRATGELNSEWWERRSREIRTLRTRIEDEGITTKPYTKNDWLCCPECKSDDVEVSRSGMVTCEDCGCEDELWVNDR